MHRIHNALKWLRVRQLIMQSSILTYRPIRSWISWAWLLGLVLVNKYLIGRKERNFNMTTKYLILTRYSAVRSWIAIIVKLRASQMTSFKINKLCAWRHNMPRPSPPRGRPSAWRAAEQMQRRSTFPRRIRSHADRCSRLTRVKRPGNLWIFWPWKWRPSPCHVWRALRPDVRDRRQTDRRQTKSSLNSPPIRGGV